MPSADTHRRFSFGDLEMVGAFFEVAPERHIRVKPVLCEVLGGHAKRIGLHLDGALATGKRLARYGVNFGDLGIGHRIAAGGRADAMHHDSTAGVTQRSIKRIWIADIE